LSSYDYIVVGAGSAGCVVANRLTEDGASTVLLLEAGGSDAHPFIRMPAAFSLPMNSKRFNWGFETEPEPGLGGRRLHCPRGRVLGGSSSINGMVYVRGNPLDFERWQTLGAEGWGYADVLPYFMKAERLLIDGRPDNSYRGHGGPLCVTRGSRTNRLHDMFLEACEQAGHARSDDLNGYRQEGCGDFEMTVAGGVRWSAARAYLKDARKRTNLHLVRHALVERIVCEDTTAAGVNYRSRGMTCQARARREVIICAGAIGSPHLLQLSGIGDARHLEPLGIQVVRDLPAVGANLMDHLEVYCQQACTKPLSLNRHLNLPGKGMIGLQWLLSRSGLGTTNHFETGAFLRSDERAPYPDIQMHFLPAAVSYDGSRPAAVDGYQLHVGPMLSQSRGGVTLRSSDPAQHPIIRFNYMSTPDDWRVFRRAIQMAREIFAQPAFDGVRGPELAPGPEATSDEAIDDFIRKHAESAYHPCGTCRMGRPDDDAAVVDPECRVRGIDRLRVVDSSVFPHITNGNLNGPTIMLAEKAADFLKGAQLPRAEIDYYRAEVPPEVPLPAE
jgi:choline dehydrogenase